MSVVGLSPRTRGNPTRGRSRCWPCWSIPANAGEPVAAVVTSRAMEVYPRERGGTGRRCTRTRNGWGLSPRTRGNRLSAHAAKNGAALNVCSFRLPKTCSFRLPLTARRACPVRGLSPRTRGNREIDKHTFRDSGSIPANAGEPSATSTTALTSRVYPRERGGTTTPDLDLTISLGLSPRTRGNPAQRVGRHQPPRSIPANAGEPSRRTTPAAM